MAERGLVAEKLVGVAGIGLSYGRKHRDTLDYDGKAPGARNSSWRHETGVVVMKRRTASDQGR